ncbi:type II toxin-antitoxin system VapC family toxin [Sulfurivermis fontis]|uniref:type II toxin-antitoxin system VapC family toxin n=1 Tax=Sulfurivermis fontis TaxID=1972068 RepID=UPI000FDA8FB9|nr:type II toxin-antitoxin system VapC family toxin [Sulfurivermis fontis]
MILLDTNLISEPLRAAPEPRVVAWLDAQPLETLFLSVVTVAELRYGVARLPNGRRRKILAEHLETQVLPAFATRILAFDLPATQVYADLMAKAQAAGQPIGMADGLIAAIARTHGMRVATRDTAPFAAAGVPVINPWSEGSP